MAKYIYIELVNIEPLRIADDSSSQMGQTTTMHYIPATSIRGMVVTALSRRKDFEDLKQRLFSNEVKFLNAYPIIKGEEGIIELLPSPKGFYEDKTSVKGVKRIENVVSQGIFKEGLKRAALGEFAFIEQKGQERVIRYMRVSTGSDLKIKINLQEGDEQTVFRNEYIIPGNTFAAYIQVEDENLLEIIKSVFKEVIIIGNARSAGLGKCRVAKIEVISRTPFGQYALSANTSGSVYMLLLSHMVMRSDSGEYCGIDLNALAMQMGVTNLWIDHCATTAVDVRGYNRKWGIRTPSVMMYEKGSVFKLKFDGELKVEKMLEVMDKGVGVRTNEGFGRILFVEDYESITGKEIYDVDRNTDRDNTELTAEDKHTLKVIAKNYYRSLYHRQSEKYVVNLGFDKGGVKASKLGKVEAFTTLYRFNYKDAVANLDQYFAHAREKQAKQRVQYKEQSDIKNLDTYVTGVLNWTLEDFENALGIITKDPDLVMGINKKDIISDEDLGRMKLELITQAIRFDNKKKDRKKEGND